MPDQSRYVTAVLLLVGAAVLVLLGRWGKRNANTLVPSAFSDEGRRQRAQSIRRNGTACQVFACLLLLTSVGMLALPLSSF